MIRKALRLLHVEDSEDDALLVSKALERQGYDIQSSRVMTAEGFRTALGDGGFEMILCDYAMPSFDAFEALEILRESGKDIPLVIVSGAIGELQAVKAMKQGAADYLFKDNLARLGTVVERELREAETRRQKRLSDSFVQSQTEVLRANEFRYLTQRNALIALTRDTQPQILQIEDAFLRITEATAMALGVGRVGIWRFTHDRKRIECLDLYEPALDRHSSGSTLIASYYPHYFECLETKELIAADDALNDPCTREFRDGYLMPLGIGAIIDVPVRQGNRVEHLLSCEHLGPMRQWTPDEKTFAVAVANLISLSLEIRGRTLAQKEVLKSHQRFQDQASLLDKARDAILVRDLDHNITYWNKSAERLYGWTADEALGRSLVELLYLEKSGYFAAHEQTLLHGEWLGELTQVDKSGRELIIEGRWSLVTDDMGRPQSVLAINTDISEYRRLEQQFIRAQRLESIGILAGGIAHDLNNILTPISMAVELLKMREPGARSLELLDTIASSAKRGANMVGRVLSFARGVEGCHVRFHPRPVISEIESILRDTFPRNIELEIMADHDLWVVDGDPTQIHQVLLNLCVNAGDAITGPGRISIIAENVQIDSTFAAINLEAREGPYVCIRVRDTGEGIPADIIDRIFDPFFSTKDAGKGTGLGLPTSLAIVKSHGGFMLITSKPGAGTLARVYIPAHPESDDASRPLAAINLPSGGGETILVVDDEALIRRIACQTIENFGFRTLSAANGEEALALYIERRSEIAIVFTDLMMPVMDGPEMIARIRGINPAVKIIASSGIAPIPDSPHFTMDSMRHFLPKPYTAETLLKCIGQTLEDDETPSST